MTHALYCSPRHEVFLRPLRIHQRRSSGLLDLRSACKGTLEARLASRSGCGQGTSGCSAGVAASGNLLRPLLALDFPFLRQMSCLTYFAMSVRSTVVCSATDKAHEPPEDSSCWLPLTSKYISSRKAMGIRCKREHATSRESMAT